MNGMINFFNVDTKQKIDINNFYKIIQNNEDINNLINYFEDNDIDKNILRDLKIFQETKVFNSLELDVPFYNFIKNNKNESCIIFGMEVNNEYQFYSNIITSTEYEALEEIITTIDFIGDIPVYCMQQEYQL